MRIIACAAVVSFLLVGCGGGSSSSSDTQSENAGGIVGADIEQYVAYSSFPQTMHGVVYYFPGEEWTPDRVLQSVEGARLLNQLAARGYGVILPRAPDAQSLQWIEDLYLENGILSEQLPRFGLAFSTGAKLAMNVAQERGFAALALQGSSALPTGEEYATPTLMIVGKNDSKVSIPQANQDFRKLKELRVSTHRYINRPEPLTVERLQRIPGLSLEAARDLLQALMQGQFVNPSGALIDSPDKLNWLAGLPDAYQALKDPIRETLMEVWGGHTLTSDLTAEIHTFFRNQLVQGPQTCWQGPKLSPYVVNTSDGYGFTDLREHPETKAEKEASRTAIFYFPNKFKGVVYFFHGVNGHPEAWFQNIEMSRVALDAIANGYGVVALERDVDSDENGWGVYDIPYFEKVHEWFQSKSYYDSSTPIYSIGFSYGAYGAMWHGYSLGSQAIVCYGASGMDIEDKLMLPRFRPLNLDLTIPVRWYIGTNDSEHRLQDSIKNQDYLLSRGVDALATEVLRAPLTEQRMCRIPGVSSAEAQAIFTLLVEANVVHTGSLLPKSYWSARFSSIQNTQWQEILGSDWVDRKANVRAQFPAMNAEHAVYSDVSGEIITFLNTYEP